jgi:hypothetical protein
MTRARDLAKGTFSGDLTVDTNTLVVDSANNTPLDTLIFMPLSQVTQATLLVGLMVNVCASTPADACW